MWSQNLLAIIGIFFAFGITFVGIVSANRRARMKQELLMKMAETGQPIPPDHLRSILSDRSRSGKFTLRGALIVTAAGIGVILYGWILGQTALAAAGVIPLLIGLAMLLATVIEERKIKTQAMQGTTDKSS